MGTELVFVELFFHTVETVKLVYQSFLLDQWAFGYTKGFSVVADRDIEL